MTINVNVWWVVVVGAAVALYFAAKVLRAAAERFMARIEALTQVFASVSVQLGELSKRLEGAENIGGYLAGLQRVAEAQVAAATKLAVSVEAFEGIVFAPPTTSGSGRTPQSPLHEPTEAAATLEYFAQQFQRDEGMNEDEARHRAILEAEVSTNGGTPGY